MSQATLSAEERYRLLVEGAKDYAMILMDAEGRVTGWNLGAERLTGWTEAEAMDQPADIIFTPEDRAVGLPAQEMERAATQGKAMDLRWHQKKDGSRFYADGILEGLRDEAGRMRGFAKILRDATARYRSDETIAERARLLMLAAEVGHALTTRRTMPDMLLGCTEALVTHLQAAFARVWVLNESENMLVLQASAGLYTHLDGPHGRVPVGQMKIGQIARERRPHLTNAVVGDPNISDQEWAKREGMVAFAGYPLVVEERLIGVVALFARHILPDVTLQALGAVADQIAVGVDRIRAEEALREANQRTSDILESITDAFFALDREWRFTYLNDQAEKLLLRPRADLLGKNVWEEFPAAVGTTFEREYGRAMSEHVAVTYEAYYPPPLDDWFEVRAYPAPDGLLVYFHEITSRKQVEAERERLLAEAQTRAEREAMVGRIGSAIRSELDPHVIQETAAERLGETLGADRCFYLTYDAFRDTAIVGRDFHHLDLNSLAGQYRLSDFRQMLAELFESGETAVIPDVRGALSSNIAETMESTGNYAVLAVPFFEEGKLTAALWASARSPRAWTKDEAALMEQAATLTRTALEAARITRKEHAIAQQLQDALQPALPEHVPGLSVGRFAKAALDESEVGGDFMDLFPLDKELYALVIGDVSGKGLAAAQQLALIRNSLRTTLYLYRAPAKAISSLNAIVTSYDLLAGFVTAFVGIYDSASGEISYVSCGHEPALIRRAGGAVEALTTTGPPLGAAESAAYDVAQVRLAAGDCLLLYTDGLSEAGPSRREMLGTDGMIRILEELDPSRDMQAQAEALVAQVSAYTNGIFRDDVAVLFACRE